MGVDGVWVEADGRQRASGATEKARGDGGVADKTKEAGQGGAMRQRARR